MKKGLCAVLIAAMLLGLAACGGSGSAPAEKAEEPKKEESASSGKVTELTFWGHQEEAWNISYQKIADEFMAENPDIRIKFEFFPYDDFESKVQTSLMSKTADADMYEIWGGWGLDYANTGALAAMSDDIYKEITEDAYPSTYGALEYDGKLYGMPMEFNIECGGLLVNQKLLEENGFSIPTTWDQMIEDAKAATVIENGEFQVKGFDFVGWDGVPYMFAEMIMSQGAQYMTEDGKFNVTSPEAVKAFTALTDYVVKDQITDLQGLTDASAMENFQRLYAGQVLYVPHGPWVVADGLSTFGLKYKEDFDYVALPWFGDEVAFPAETGWSIAINAASDKQEAAMRFFEYFFQDDVIMAHNVACGQIPAKKSVAHSDDYLKQFPYAEPLVGILDKSIFIGPFNTDNFKEVVTEVFTDYCTGGIYGSVEEALADMETRLDGIL